MKRRSPLTRTVLFTALCLALATPAFAAESHEKVQKKLDEFARTTIASLNRCVMPSSGKKEFTKNGDGTYSGRYVEIDPQSISTSYKKPEKSSAVQYIGYMRYTEVEYVCKGKTKAEADKGPCTPTRKESLTELIKYVKGKWTY